MNHPLDGVRQKVKRAEEHLTTIRSQIEDCLDKGEVFSERNPDDHRLLRFRFDIPQPDPVFNIIIGECLYDLRSALDHIVYQLVLVNGRIPTTDNQFPICRAPQGFDKNLRKDRLCGVSVKAKAVIERLQPYRRNDVPDVNHDPLWVLNHLNNLDKHRTLTVVGVKVAGSVIEFKDHAGSIVSTLRIDQMIRSGTEIPVTIPDSITNPGDMNVYCRGPVHVLFEDAPVEGFEVHRVIATIVKFVKDRVVPRFEPFF